MDDDPRGFIPSTSFTGYISAAEVAPDSDAFERRVSMIWTTVRRMPGCLSQVGTVVKDILEHEKVWIFEDGDEHYLSLDSSVTDAQMSMLLRQKLPKPPSALLHRASQTIPELRIAATRIIWLVMMSNVVELARPPTLSDCALWNVQGRAITIWADTFCGVLPAKKRPSDVIVTDEVAVADFQRTMEKDGHQHNYQMTPDIGAWVTMRAALFHDQTACFHFNDEDGCSTSLDNFSSKRRPGFIVHLCIFLLYGTIGLEYQDHNNQSWMPGANRATAEAIKRGTQLPLPNLSVLPGYLQRGVERFCQSTRTWNMVLGVFLVWKKWTTSTLDAGQSDNNAEVPDSIERLTVIPNGSDWESDARAILIPEESSESSKDPDEHQNGEADHQEVSAGNRIDPRFLSSILSSTQNNLDIRQGGDITNARQGRPEGDSERWSFRAAIPDSWCADLGEVTGSHLTPGVNRSTETFFVIEQPSELMARSNVAGPSRPKNIISAKKNESAKVQRQELRDFFVSLFEKHNIHLNATNMARWVKAGQIDFRPLAGGSQVHNVPRVRPREHDIEDDDEGAIRASKKGKAAETRKKPKAFLEMQSVMKL
ncbi:hypothetical protein C8R44DRAFT_944484 [Mycena epipterygia]|nr:hypothetical protein C8R44DRAFT_944484 [Mycena epipterygia]